MVVTSGGLAAGGLTMRGQKDYAHRLGKVMLSSKAPLDNFPKVEISEADRGKIATPHDDHVGGRIKSGRPASQANTGGHREFVLQHHL